VKVGVVQAGHYGLTLQIYAEVRRNIIWFARESWHGLDPSTLQNDARPRIEVTAIDHVQDAAIFQLHPGLFTRLVPLHEISYCSLHDDLISLPHWLCSALIPKV
jgi:hypothetical protein